MNTTTHHRRPGLLAVALLAGIAGHGPAAAQDAAATKDLPTVRVQSDVDAPDGYRATTTRVGKTLQDPHDIPQAVTTITSALMEEQQVGSLREALRNVSGLTFNAAEGGRSGDNMNLRGFYTFGDMYLDGIRDTAQYNRETFNLEQVDVLRGAGAMLFGRGQAGGVINLVSKTPLRLDKYSLTASAGTDDYREVTADLNKALDRNTAVRVNLMQRDEGSWRSNPATGDEPEVHRRGIGVSLGLNLYTNNQFWLNHYTLKTRDNPDYGISFDTATRQPSDRLPASYFWGTARTFDKSDTSITTLVHEYSFSGDSRLRTQLRLADYERTYWAKTPNLTTPPAANAVPGGNQTRAADYETVTVQSDYDTRFKALGMSHEVVTGVEYLKENSYRIGLQNLGGTTNANPPLYLPNQEARAATPVRFKSASYAVYAQDTVEFVPQWKATLGVRRDEMDAAYASTTSPALKFGENSYRTALSYHPGADTHYYVARSDSFSPTADLYQTSGAGLPAERSVVNEVGAKWLLAEGDLALRAALYHAVKEWERNTDLESTAALLSRRRTTRGLELEMAGRITGNWEVFAGLARMEAVVNEQHDGSPVGTFAAVSGGAYAAGQAVNANQIVYLNRSQQVSEGNRPRNTPRYTINAWTSYQFAPGWKVGGGFETKGDRYGYGIGTCNTATQNATTGLWTYNACSTAFTPNIAPSYVRWDAMLSHEQKDWSVRLNIRNVFNKLYYDAIYDNGGFAIPGTRRAAIVTAQLKF